MYQQLHKVLEAAFCHLADKILSWQILLQNEPQQNNHCLAIKLLCASQEQPTQALLHFGGKYFMQVNTHTTYAIVREIWERLGHKSQRF